MCRPTRWPAAWAVVPEMQIINETTVAGYANYMRSAVQNGVGSIGADRSAETP